MTIWKLSIAAAAACALAGCQTTSTDPTQGGFFGGVYGLSSGAYDQRIDERQQKLENEQDRNVALTRENERLSQQQVATRARLTQLEEDYAALTDDLDAMRRRLAEAEGDTEALERQRAQLQQQVDLAKSDSFTDDAVRQQRLEELQRKKALLEAEIDAALGG